MERSAFLRLSYLLFTVCFPSLFLFLSFPLCFPREELHIGGCYGSVFMRNDLFLCCWLISYHFYHALFSCAVSIFLFLSFLFLPMNSSATFYLERAFPLLFSLSSYPSPPGFLISYLALLSLVPTLIPSSVPRASPPPSAFFFFLCRTTSVVPPFPLPSSRLFPFLVFLSFFFPPHRSSFCVCFFSFHFVL